LRLRPRLEALEDRWLPRTLTVTSAKDHGPGTLRAEIAAAQPKDVIVFSPKLDGKTITLTAGELDITKDLTSQGPGAGQLTISGNEGNTDSSRVFEVAANATVTLSGLTISNGNGATTAGTYGPLGGGILNQGILTVSGWTISGNSIPAEGGGIYNAGTLSVSSCTVSGNYGAYGGGIYNAGTATVSGSTFSDNQADPSLGGGTLGSPNGGGAIYTYSATLTVSNSVFSINTPDNIYGPYADGGGNTFR
jgi:hypothetical protein